MKIEPVISVITSTYNRCQYLPNLYHSLCKSTFKNFEWLIVDDGSADDTREVVAKLIEEAEFPIIYQYQKNSGKHVALNRLYNMAHGQYCFNIDDDDEIAPAAMELALNYWNGIPADEREKYWCVCGRTYSSETGSIQGELFPDWINDLRNKNRRKWLESSSGDKLSLQRTECVRKYPFPEIEGLKFIQESIVWKRLNSDYESYYVNDVFSIVNRYPGSHLSNRKKTEEGYKSDILMYRILLNDPYCRSRFLSRSYLIDIYQLRLALTHCKESENISTKEMKTIDRIILTVTIIPCRILQRIRGER